MSDFIWLIHADSAGDPAEPGTIGHFVLVSPTPQPAFNEFNDGGRYQHADCGPAAILSALAARGQHPTATEVETACSTNGGGTQVKGVSAGLGHFGVVNTWEQGHPDPGYIMNPAGGRIIPPSEFPAYLAASQGWVISFASVPAPFPPASKGDPDVWLYQHLDGTIYVCNGWTPHALSFIADVQYLEGLGYKLVLASKLTTSGNSVITGALGLS